MFNFLLCCFKKKKKIKYTCLKPIRDNALEIEDTLDTFVILETNIDNYYLSNNIFTVKNNFKSKEELHKIFLEKRKKRKEYINKLKQL